MNIVGGFGPPRPLHGPPSGPPGFGPPSQRVSRFDQPPRGFFDGGPRGPPGMGGPFDGGPPNMGRPFDGGPPNMGGPFDGGPPSMGGPFGPPRGMPTDMGNRPPGSYIHAPTQFGGNRMGRPW